MTVAGTNKQAIAWLRLLLVPGIGPLLGRKVVDAVGGVARVWSDSDDNWSNVSGIGSSPQHALKASRPDSVIPVLKQCEAAKIRLISSDDDLWPKVLNDIDDAPLLLFVKGDASVLSSAMMLAVVGARRASREGILISRRRSRCLSDQGVTIVNRMPTVSMRLPMAAHLKALHRR